MSHIVRGSLPVILSLTYLSAALLAALLTAGGAAAAEVTAPPPRAVADDRTWMPEPGFTSLITGTDLSGWHYKGEPDLGTATEATDGRYSGRDGMLVVNPEVPGKGPHLRQLWTLRTFPTDFTLKLEFRASVEDRKSTRLNSSHSQISYAVFC